MSIIRNRELSQFGSFVYIDNNNENISITDSPTPYVGIGTTTPSVKLEVLGDTNIKGNFTVSNGTIEATSYTLNGNLLVDPTSEKWSLGIGTDIYRLNGDVGIGTTNPLYKLDVKGDINLTGTLYQNGVIFSGSKWTSGSGNDIYRLNGNIGIGTSTISEKLTVSGNVSAGQIISTVSSGTPPLVVLSDTQVTNLNASFLRGKLPPSGDIVGTTDTQTLSNKTLTSPTLNSPVVNSVGIQISGSTSGSTIIRASAVASGTIIIPAANDTLVARNTTDTLTNKTIAAGSNTITGLTNSNLSGSAGITNANLATPTISGISLGNDLSSLSFGSYLSSSGSYNGSTARTVSVAGTSINTANTLVARDINGNFTAGSINCSNLTASFTVTAADINSTSDENLKENIHSIENSLNTVKELRGVSFDWKSTGKSSYGVIAQELEKVLPELVSQGESKSVNYNGLIGFLIEAIKELSEEVEDLKRKTL